MGVVPALKVHGLSFAFPGGAPVLSGVSFALQRGERAAILGPNGAGKSTLLWCLVGVLSAQGEVVVGGTRLCPGTEREVRRKIGLVFAEPEDQLFMPTVGRDLAFGPRAAGDAPRTAAERAAGAAAQVGLGPELLERGPHELSSGERRRAALAAVMALAPEVLAMDEPTNSLDARGRAELVSTLRALPCTQLVATHDLEFTQAVCERALVLVDGRLMADEPLEHLLADADRLVEYGLLAPGMSEAKDELPEANGSRHAPRSA